jgi:hypothetical protein
LSLRHLAKASLRGRVFSGRLLEPMNGRPGGVGECARMWRVPSPNQRAHMVPGEDEFHRKGGFAAGRLCFRGCRPAAEPARIPLRSSSPDPLVTGGCRKACWLDEYWQMGACGRSGKANNDVDGGGNCAVGGARLCSRNEVLGKRLDRVEEVMANAWIQRGGSLCGD